MYLLKKPQNKLFSLFYNQTFLFDLLVIALFLFLSIAFPSRNSAQLLTKDLFFLFFLPIAYFKLFFSKNLSHLGFNWKNKFIGFLWSIAFLFILLLLFYLFLKHSSFPTNYQLPPEIMSNFWFFLGYELFLVNFIIFINEFFFRGFIISLFREKLKHWTIAFQALIYLSVLWFTNSLSWQILPFILFSVSGGILTYKTKSFLYSYFLHFFVIIILDSYLIYLAK